jgi:hypothetical protein
MDLIYANQGFGADALTTALNARPSTLHIPLPFHVSYVSFRLTFN